ncbi:hypothetical protein [Paenibacillus alvei]|uniref:hypothetical protein n=1 Tax=Paenibacillus alvei TaxID=44250 RepID=UPI0018CF9E2E|nr:hypothetical protein [Paenibacillus alvei]MBG9733592.1 hypothetical protein [Paenibacillus alvei]MBG9745043.1 hypothetical protein [Paenibacillus alvei]MCY9582825.1 hypothetical protein [Paenibacillus alvei]MCY9587400.1 hypothetical protein [Paenibacillus alvei]
MMKWLIRAVVFVATVFIGFGIAKWFGAIGKPWTAGIIYGYSIVTVSITDYLIRIRQKRSSLPNST